MTDIEISSTKINCRAELDAEISKLEAEITAAKTKRIYDLATKDAEISKLEAEITAAKTNSA